MTSPEQRMADLLKTFGDPAACTAQLLCDRHPADAVAFTVVGADLGGRDMTFGELRESSARMASALTALGVGPGDRVATLMSKSAELLVATLAIWRIGAVQVPLFTAFAPPAIALRVTGNGTKVVITDAGQRPKLAAGPDLPADRPWRIVTTGPTEEGDLSFAELLAEHPPLAEPAALGGDATIVELFTSGTSGPPKAVPIPLRAVAGFAMYQEFGLDHRPTDVFWNAADPGWAYGLYYAIIAPLALGLRSLLFNSLFSAEGTWAVLSRFHVTNFTAGPTVYRKLRGTPAPDGVRLRCASAAGEPLPADVVTWAERTLGIPVRDHYGSTELGMAIANAWHPALRTDLKPGSMGRPLPGWSVTVLREDTNSAVAGTGMPGRVAMDITKSPLMWFEGYRDAPERTAEKFSPDGHWFYSGDTAARDEDGHLFFSGRGDDVILMAGYRIGPFEVESVLLEHEAVAEAAAVGVPREEHGEVMEAFVVLRAGVSLSDPDALAAELQQLVRDRLAKHAYPRSVHFVAELPKTSSGKTQRFLLRPRQAGSRAR